MGVNAPCHLAILVAAGILTGCAKTPAPVAETPPPDPTTESWYPETVAEITALHRDALRLYRSGRPEEASGLILKGQPLLNRVLQVPKPTLAAVEAASDMDDLYGRMLLANKHPVWARQMFQKNAARWKNWQPQTAETAQRLKVAQDAIAECDRQP